MRLADMGWFWKTRQGGKKREKDNQEEGKRGNWFDREGSIRRCKAEKKRNIPKNEQQSRESKR